ncbi:MAG TPA: YdcF family protein [Ramlibacter sp.]|nr:YdcF family protein [Ramlibacter sp.]
MRVLKALTFAAFASAGVLWAADHLLGTDEGENLLVTVLRSQTDAPTGREQAIVVPTGGAPRVEAALELQRRTGLPLLLTGQGDGEYERVLRSAAAGPVLHEGRATDTEQNAAYSRCVAGPRRWQSVYLVSDALHLRRASAWFRWYGFEVTAVDSGMPGGGLPQWRGNARHEWAGLVEFTAKALAWRRLPCPA